MSTLAVYDCMLFFQAASRPSRVHGTFRAILDGRVTLCLSAEVLSEIRDVLTRPEHRVRFPALTPQLVDAFLSQYLPGMRWVADVPPAFDVPRNPKDNPYVNLAVAAAHKYLVTWNHRHLGYLDAAGHAGGAGLLPTVSFIADRRSANDYWVRLNHPHYPIRKPGTRDPAVASPHHAESAML